MEAVVSLEFIDNLKPSEKADYGDDRDGDMNGKPEFSDAAGHGIIFGDLITSGVALRAGILAADGGTKAQKDALVPLVEGWDKLAKKWARYVSEKASEKNTLSEQIAVINASGFSYNKVDRTPGQPSPQVTGFKMKPIAGVMAKAIIASDSLGSNTTYITVCHKEAQKLDDITWDGDQIILPVTTEPFVVHYTTSSRDAEVTLSSGVKWHGMRFALNKSGRGPNSEKSSVTPQ